MAARRRRDSTNVDGEAMGYRSARHFLFHYHRLERTLAGDLTAGGRSFPEIGVLLSAGAGRAITGEREMAIATWCWR